jgi:predicted ester cyclase
LPTAEETANRATYRRLHDAVNTRDEKLIAKMIDEVVEPDVRFNAPVPMGRTSVEALKLVWTNLLRAYPDIEVKNHDLIAEGDRVVARNTVTGTQRGEYFGHAPTDKSVKYDEIFIFRFVNGRIAEIWGVVDVLAQMRQLGFVRA